MDSHEDFAVGAGGGMSSDSPSVSRRLTWYAGIHVYVWRVTHRDASRDPETAVSSDRRVVGKSPAKTAPALMPGSWN
jgi:hypothetical protein